MIKTILNILAGCSVAYAAASAPGSSDSPLNLNSYRIPLSLYGGEAGDDSFQRNTRVIVADLTKKIQRQRPAAKICGVAAEFRGKIAQKTQTTAAELFGAPRGGELAREIDVTPLRKFPLMEQRAKALHARFSSAPQGEWQPISNLTRLRVRTGKLPELVTLLKNERMSSETSVPSYADLLLQTLLNDIDRALMHLSLAPTESEADRYYDLRRYIQPGSRALWIKSNSRWLVIACHHTSGEIIVASCCRNSRKTRFIWATSKLL